MSICVCVCVVETGWVEGEKETHLCVYVCVFACVFVCVTYTQTHTHSLSLSLSERRDWFNPYTLNPCVHK